MDAARRQLIDETEQKLLEKIKSFANFSSPGNTGESTGHALAGLGECLQGIAALKESYGLSLQK